MNCSTCSTHGCQTSQKQPGECRAVSYLRGTPARWPRDISGAFPSHRLPHFSAAARHLRNNAPYPAFSLISLPFCTSAHLLPSFVNSSAGRAADAALSTLFNPNQPSSILLPWLRMREIIEFTPSIRPEDRRKRK